MTQYSLVRHIHALTPLNEIWLILVFIENKITKKNYPLDLLVNCFGLKYKLIDIESLSVISPNFEPNYWAYMKPNKGDVFIDIGAHVGKYTMQAAKIVGDNGKVIAVEADPITFKALSDGIIANGFRNVVALNIAIYDKECEVALHSVPIDGKTEMGKGFTSVKRYVGPSVFVKAKPLDFIVNTLNLARVNFIKIDVEGAELEVLKGARKTIEKFKPILVIEISMSKSEIFEIMNESRYSSRSIGPSYFCFTPINRF